MTQEMPLIDFVRASTLDPVDSPESPKEIMGIAGPKIRALLLPIIVVEFYLFMTFILYVIGPVRWLIPSPGTLILFVAVSYLAFGAGYVLCARRHRRRLGQVWFSRDGVGSFKGIPETVFTISAIFNIVALLVLASYFMGGISIGNILHPGEAYFFRLTEFSAGRNVFVQFCSWFWAATYYFYPLGVLYWEQMNKSKKLLFVASLIVSIIYWLNLGTMKGLGDLVICLVPLFILKKYVFGEDHSECSLRRTVGRRMTVVVVSAAMLFLLTFSIITTDRQQSLRGERSEPTVVTSLTYPFITAEHSHTLSRVAGPVITGLVIKLSHYMTHGYTGLAYAMQLPFVWTYGVGHSRTLSELMDTYLHTDVSSRTYLARNEVVNGWPARELWSTVLVWLASDVSFYGVPVVMMLMGYLLGCCWIHCISTKNLHAKAAICQLFIFVFFVPANNQLVQSRQSLFGTVLLFALYVASLSRKRPREHQGGWNTCAR